MADLTGAGGGGGGGGGEDGMAWEVKISTTPSHVKDQQPFLVRGDHEGQGISLQSPVFMFLFESYLFIYHSFQIVTSSVSSRSFLHIAGTQSSVPNSDSLKSEV